MWKLTIAAISCGGFWLLSASTASSQSMRPFDAAGPQNARAYFTAAYSRPPVSPYVNLGVNANGLSNYQTLVRPLVEEREAIERQGAALDRLNQRMRGAGATGDWRDLEEAAQGARRQTGVRFMHYSHYYGTFR